MTAKILGDLGVGLCLFAATENFTFMQININSMTDLIKSDYTIGRVTVKSQDQLIWGELRLPP